LCWLFSKPADSENEVPLGAHIDEILRLFESSSPEEEILESNGATLLSHIERDLGIVLSPEDRSTVVLQNMKRFLELYDSQAFRSYWDVCTIGYR
jgi:hypothetical protein